MDTFAGSHSSYPTSNNNICVSSFVCITLHMWCPCLTSLSPYRPLCVIFSVFLYVCLSASVRIELEDFCHCFLYMTISCENPNFLDGDVTCQWKCMIHDGRWQAGTSAGGSAGNGRFHYSHFTLKYNHEDWFKFWITIIILFIYLC